jgi:hypothetical protein
VTVLSTSIPMVVVLGLLAGAGQAPAPAQPLGPETFDAKVTLDAPPPAVGTVVVPVTIQIDRYTPEHARTTMSDALKHNGYPGFLRALREAPPAGHVDINGRKVTIRWARQVPDDTGRQLSFVTDQPIYFVGGALKNAKPKAGYEVGVILMHMDKAGKGDGTIAAAARVKPYEVTGVQLDDYAEKPVKVTATVRAK